ncbi:hypothetical protein KG112_14520 [Nocardioides sp. zg-ZUI104]|uniref:sensor histidine kinase n=1 Tax=Nocardioides faecalis TaxID=2803858 RepID=UPI001BCCE39A|nr:histidine kinase [Nocardioides faecalis]MBS4754025.1 hypothetical protein [Nocardioides faecalis]
MRRWSQLSQVERVDRYTRQSLYLFLWGYVALIWFNGYERAEQHPVVYGALCLLAAVLTASAAMLMRRVLALYPATAPLPWRSIGVFALLCVLLVAAGASVSGGTRGLAVLTVGSAAAWTLGGLRDRRILVALVLGIAALFGITTQDVVIALGVTVVVLFLVFTVQVSLWLLGVVTELDQARGAQAALAVAEERLRFSRDVHDVLGRRLAAIAVQAELAATLAERGDASVAERMLAVRETAHEAMREARELARGYRATDLSQELDGARSLLSSAGIDVDVAVEDVPVPWREPVAWVVRESVTNVLRHSSATRVRIGYADGELTVHNDGPVTAQSSTTAARGSGSGTGSGSGLRGLRERLAPLGATLTAEPTTGDRPGEPGTGFRVVARFPAIPLEPAAATVVSA